MTSSDASRDIERILRTCSTEVSSGEILRLMHAAWSAGHSAGFAEGTIRANAMASISTDMVLKALTR
jgi:hypothetical protein